VDEIEDPSKVLVNFKVNPECPLRTQVYKREQEKGEKERMKLREEVAKAQSRSESERDDAGEEGKKETGILG
jgi:hypothetical protein